MSPEAITPAVEFLLSEDAPTRTIMGAGAGSFAVIKIMETEGVNLPQSEWTPDAVAAHFAEISDMSKAKALQGAFEQTQKYVGAGRGEGGDKAVSCNRRSFVRMAGLDPAIDVLRARQSDVDARVPGHDDVCAASAYTRAMSSPSKSPSSAPVPPG